MDFFPNTSSAQKGHRNPSHLLLHTVTGGSCWPAEVLWAEPHEGPVPYLLLPHTLPPAPEEISAAQEFGQGQGTPAPRVCPTECSSSAGCSWRWLQTEQWLDTNPCAWFLLHLAIQSIAANPFSFCCSPPHFPLHLKDPEAISTSWPFRNAWILFLPEKDWISALPCPHSYIPHAISTRVTLWTNTPFNLWAQFKVLSISWLLSHDASTDCCFLIFTLLYRTRVFKALLTLTMWLQLLRKKHTSSHCPAVYKYLLNCKSAASLARQHYRSEFHRRHEAQWTWLLLPEHLCSSLSFTIMF